MRLLFLTSLVMIAFAANSVLNRMALVGDGTGPAAFAMIRLAAGAVFLLLLATLRSDRAVPWRANGRVWGVLMLALYVLGFSFAYVSLNTGVGALILFGGVQITMFAGALIAREAVPAARWIGAAIAFGGLMVLLLPAGGVAPDPVGALLMAAAAIGWGVYSLLGRGVDDPLGSTAANFALALPIGVVVFAIFSGEITPRGATLAVISGAVTSGAGYALWYSVLPRLAASVAAVAQLTVPVIAAAGGVVFLGEPVSLRFFVAAALVLLGIAISLRPSAKN
ncbi:MAG: DMT family transporter [Paracoccaceae bacterium]